MSEFIGVKKLSDFQTNPSFKRDALIFDRIAINNVGDCRRMILEGSTKDDFKFKSQEFDWVLKNEIVFEPGFSNEQLKAILSDTTRIDAILQLRGEHQDLPMKLGLKVDTDFWNWWDMSCDYDARYLAAILRAGRRDDAYPISNLTYSKGNDDRDEVVTIVINNLPIPNESTPWEQITEFRSDSDSRSKFLSLRNWIGDISKHNLTPMEVEQKLEYLMDQYQRHMQLHRMKTNVGALETIIVSAAESLEDLVKFNWGKLAKSLFSFRQRKVTLLEAEHSAPGREIAYLLKANDEFR